MPRIDSGERYHVSGNRSCDAHFDQRPARGNPRADPDHRPGGSTERGRGQYVGPRSANAMAAAEEIVPRLVGQQNPQKRQRERPATGQRRGMIPDPVQREKIALVGQRWLVQAKVAHEQRARARGGEDTHHQQAKGQPGNGVGRPLRKIRELFRTREKRTIPGFPARVRGGRCCHEARGYESSR